MQQVRTFLTAVVVSAFASMLLHAQHCPPIYESYLSEIGTEKAGDSLKIRLEYTKLGGQPKPAYQAYLIAYLDRDAARLCQSEDEIINRPLMVVLGTQLIRRQEDGTYPFAFEINQHELANKVIEHFKLGDKDRSNNGGWGEFRPKVKLAVFIPFLEDAKYSVLPGLPDNKHECNYGRQRALLWQTLPTSLSINFGIVKAKTLPEGQYAIQINGDKLPQSK